MKYIYVLMVQLPTTANKISATLHGFKYIHAAISLDENLSKMYAFQIKNKDNPLVAGFMEETHAHYFHGKKCRVDELIFKIPVTDEEYSKIIRFIKRIKHDNEYIFNSIATLFMFYGLGFSVPKAYHCIEFVCEALKHIETLHMPKPTYKMLPRDLHNVLLPYFVKRRRICSRHYTLTDDIYFQDLKFNAMFKRAFYAQKEAIYRTVRRKVSKSFDYRKLNYCRRDIKNQ